LAVQSPFEVEMVAPGRVVVSGEVDREAAPVLLWALDAALWVAVDRPVPELVVDLAAVDFLDAAGIGVLIGTANRARRAGGRVVLRAPSRAACRVLQVVGLDRTFPLVD
jgi:anti-sigma B factor antagonist